MIKHLLIAASMLFSGVCASAQRSEQTGDSIVPPGAEKYRVGVYYRITSLLFHTVELSGFISGQDRETIDIPDQVYDSVAGVYYKVTSVAPDAFKGKTVLKNVTLPNTITRIGKESFRGCSIEKAVIPGSNYHVEEGAYADNPLKEVYIYSPGENGAPNYDHSVELQNNAFGSADDPNLTDVYITYKEPPIVADGATPFPRVAAHNSSAVLHVKSDADKDRYKNDYCWKDFYSLDTTGIETVASESENAPTEYYTIQGVRADASNLTPGLYIVRQGEKVQKVVVN